MRRCLLVALFDAPGGCTRVQDISNYTGKPWVSRGKKQGDLNSRASRRSGPRRIRYKLSLMKSRPMHPLVFIAAAALSAWTLAAQTLPNITTPKEALGFNIGDDYQVANYTQLETYWKKLAAESPRMKLESIGKTEEGRDQWMAVITSPDNMKKLARYKEIAGKLAHAEGVSEQEARTLAKEGKAIVWIDGGLHATETVGSQQLMEWVYQMVSRTDEETMRFLNDVIVLNVQANPDGPV